MALIWALRPSSTVRTAGSAAGWRVDPRSVCADGPATRRPRMPDTTKNATSQPRVLVAFIEGPPSQDVVRRGRGLHDGTLGAHLRCPRVVIAGDRGPYCGGPLS